jgi:AcrR family transcriptional regulator
MTENADLVIGSDRGRRVLDAAAELVLRRGYQRVTVDDVARRAGVGKGTVYLHFRSRTWLFLCVLMRESLDLIDELVAAIEREPAAALISEQVRTTYLAVQQRPLLLAVYTRDAEMLGKLVNDGQTAPLHGWNADLAGDLFRLLRAHGLLRTDLDVDTQCQVVGAVQTGFHLHRPALGSAEQVAAALHHTVRAAVEPTGPPDPDALAAVAPEVVARYRGFRATLAAAITSQETPT